MCFGMFGTPYNAAIIRYVYANDNQECWNNIQEGPVKHN